MIVGADESEKVDGLGRRMGLGRQENEWAP